MVFVEKSEECNKIGLEVDRSEQTTLRIKNVKDGLIHQWNLEHPDQPVKSGDRIVEVNGCQGDALSLLEACRGDQVVMKIEVCPPPLREAFNGMAPELASMPT